MIFQILLFSYELYLRHLGVMIKLVFCFSYSKAEFLFVRSWLPCIFFSGGVTMGNIGRQLALVLDVYFTQHLGQHIVIQLRPTKNNVSFIGTATAFCQMLPFWLIFVLFLKEEELNYKDENWLIEYFPLRILQ